MLWNGLFEYFKLNITLNEIDNRLILIVGVNVVESSLQCSQIRLKAGLNKPLLD